MALTALTAILWLLMSVVRNYAILRDLTQGDDYRTYDLSLHPAEWIERLARTFNNLDASTVIVLRGRPFDDGGGATGRGPAGAGVGVRGGARVHATVYATVNHLPSRFGSWTAASITLRVIWARFSGQVWHFAVRLTTA